MSLSTFKLAGVLVVFALLESSHALSGDVEIVVMAAGEAYEGDPKFRLVADGILIGERQLQKSVDTASGGTLATSSLGDHLERFEFTLPSIETITHFEVQFINDAWAGENKRGDRNLFVISVSINEHRFDSSALKPVVKDPKGAHVGKDWVALFSAGSVRLQRPENGWTALATKALGNPAQCNKIGTVDVMGFEEGRRQLPAAAAKQLANVAKTLKNTKCRVGITGLASGLKSYQLSKTLSEARAEAVARQLQGFGIAANRIRTRGVIGNGRRVRIVFE